MIITCAKNVYYLKEETVYNNQRIVAIITARGGSKRLLGKNILPLQGKPLIAWSIEAALHSPLIDDVIVSTDDPTIAQIARQYGAQTPFLRPIELASDAAKSIDVVLHVLDSLEHSKKQRYDHAILLQPTSPLRDTEDINGAICSFFDQNADSVIGVCEAEHNPIWSNTLNEDRNMKNFIPDQYNNLRSQDLPTYYRINGAFYMAKTAILQEQKTFFIKENIYAYLMSQEHSIDIDTSLDFMVATALLQQKETKC